MRVRSPSAEVQGHSPEQRVLVYGKRDVGIMKLHPIGNYAIRIEFDDLHNTGIFTWSFLRELGQNRDAEWAAYEAELSEAGKSREPATAEVTGFQAASRFQSVRNASMSKASRKSLRMRCH